MESEGGDCIEAQATIRTKRRGVARWFIMHKESSSISSSKWDSLQEIPNAGLSMASSLSLRGHRSTRLLFIHRAVYGAVQPVMS